jgi:hypothetical protein
MADIRYKTSADWEESGRRISKRQNVFAFNDKHQAEAVEKLGNVALAA